MENLRGLYDPRFEHDSCGVGFVCNVKGLKSQAIVAQGLEILRSLAHRGATGADPKTGDGAGILIQMPHEFMLKVAKENKIILPDKDKYGTGLVFLPVDAAERKFCKNVFTKIVKQEKQELLGWRSVPVDNKGIGKAARESQPVIEQVFIGSGLRGLGLERKLYLIRKQVENLIRASGLRQKSLSAGRQDPFYIVSLSSRTLTYKGLLMPEQVASFFPDLKDVDMQSCLSLVHSRYSTNTFPAWNLSQPFRFLAHNGEINTLRGNINWMRAREGLLRSKAFGDLKKVFPIIVPGGSDSAAIDNVFELLYLSGRPLPHTMMMLIPGAWEGNRLFSEKMKGFYRFHTCFMEPWDGPAAMAFTDGEKIGAILDRNGLRPARYLVTKNDL
ncbi:MAG: glutamate synthase subunit alpha, partial [Candidatus Omnitrophica bacterium]|nr:glutamate synthase subunit alpha [Candidatus Omnitrophota bacterium]